MEQPTENQSPPTAALTEQQILNYQEKLKMEQNLPMAIAGGLAASLAGGIVWAVVTVATGYQIGWMAGWLLALAS